MIAIDHISSLSWQEILEISGSLNASHNEEYNCNKCLAKFEGRTDEELMIKRNKERKNCETPANSRLHEIRLSEGRSIHLSRCPGNYTLENFSYYMDLYNAYQRGILPFEGSLSDQPNKVMEIFRLIQTFIDAKMKQEAEEQRKKQRSMERIKRRGR